MKKKYHANFYIAALLISIASATFAQKEDAQTNAQVQSGIADESSKALSGQAEAKNSEPETASTNPPRIEEQKTEDLVKPEPKVGSQQVEIVDVNNAKVDIQNYPWTNLELKVIAGVNLTLLILNFILYCLFKSLRNILIATPFDLFTRKSSKYQNTGKNWNKYFIELFLLVVFEYVFFDWIMRSSTAKLASNEDVRNAVTTAITHFFVWQFIYLIVRFSLGLSSNCPKCKTPFARRVNEKWDEPKVTFHKGKYLFEKGITYSNCTCAVCGHEWKKSNAYEKQLTYS